MTGETTDRERTERDDGRDDRAGSDDMTGKMKEKEEERKRMKLWSVSLLGSDASTIGKNGKERVCLGEPPDRIW